MVKSISIFFFLLLLTFTSKSQNLSELLISVEIKNLTTLHALDAVDQLDNIKLSYNPDDFSGDEKLTKTYIQTPVSEVLTDIAGSSFELESRGSYIIIKKKAQLQEKKTFVFSGEIKDATTGEIIKDVTVYEASSLDATLTDNRGNFELKVISKTDYVTIAISQAHYLDTLIQLKYASELQKSFELRPKKDTTLTQKIGIETKKLIQLFIGRESRENTRNVSLEEERPVQFSVIPKIGTNGKLSGQVSNRYSINLFAGYSKGTRVLEVGAIYNIDREDVQFLQLAGLGNAVGGNVKGVQLAGFLNSNKGSMKGVQGAGFVNLVGAESSGLQMAGFLNTVLANYEGTQIAGFVNLAHKSKGTQLAGFLNVTTKNSSGFQMSGFTNFSRDFYGTQLSGFLNLAQNVEGFQGAGFLNIANNLKGIQLGLINIADTLERGTTIGLVNIVRNGKIEAGLETNDFMDVMATFRSGTNDFYTVLSSGVRFSDDKTYAIGIGFGTQFKLHKKLHSNIELSFHNLEQGQFDKDDNFINRLNLNFGYQIAKHFSINAGPALNIYMTNSINPETGKYGYDLGQTPIYDTMSGNKNISLWIGWSTSLHF